MISPSLSFLSLTSRALSFLPLSLSYISCSLLSLSLSYISCSLLSLSLSLSLTSRALSFLSLSLSLTSRALSFLSLSLLHLVLSPFSLSLLHLVLSPFSLTSRALSFLSYISCSLLSLSHISCSPLSLSLSYISCSPLSLSLSYISCSLLSLSPFSLSFLSLTSRALSFLSYIPLSLLHPSLSSLLSLCWHNWFTTMEFSQMMRLSLPNTSPCFSRPRHFKVCDMWQVKEGAAAAAAINIFLLFHHILHYLPAFLPSSRQPFFSLPVKNTAFLSLSGKLRRTSKCLSHTNIRRPERNQLNKRGKFLQKKKKKHSKAYQVVLVVRVSVNQTILQYLPSIFFFIFNKRIYVNFFLFSLFAVLSPGSKKKKKNQHIWYKTTIQSSFKKHIKKTIK